MLELSSGLGLFMAQGVVGTIGGSYGEVVSANMEIRPSMLPNIELLNLAHSRKMFF